MLGDGGREVSGISGGGEVSGIHGGVSFGKRGVGGEEMGLGVHIGVCIQACVLKRGSIDSVF